MGLSDKTKAIKPCLKVIAFRMCFLALIFNTSNIFNPFTVGSKSKKNIQYIKRHVDLTISCKTPWKWLIDYPKWISK